jgi:GNAT superfamily N-acetyltransferase
MAEFKIRPAVPADSEGIARVRIDTWYVAYRGLIADEFLAGLSLERDTARWQENFANHRPPFTFVAEAEGGVVGFCCGGPERGADPEYGGELYAIYILPERQGQGIGKALLDAGCGWLSKNGFTKMLIWVLKDNQPARAFYAALGGRPVREKPVEIGPQTLVEVGYGFQLI